MSAASATPTASPDRASFVDVNRTTLRLWEWGDPTNPVVFCMHGAYDHGRMFDGLAPELVAMGFYVIAIDARGHGDSGDLDSGHTFDASVIDFGLLALGYDQPVGLVAHSMGSSMAFQVAATWPEAVAWVVSLDGLGPPLEAFDNPSIDDGARQQFDGAIKTFSRGRRPFPDKAAMAAQRGAINTRLPKVWLEHMVEHGSQPNGDAVSWKWDPVFNTYLPNGFTIEWATQDLQAVECPVLCLTGTAEDMWTFPEDQKDERLAMFRTAVHVPVPDAGHYLHLEQPAFTVREIAKFLGDIGAKLEVAQ